MTFPVDKGQWEGESRRDLLELRRRESQPQSIVLDLDNVYAVIICKTECTKYVVNIHPKSGCPSDIELSASCLKTCIVTVVRSALCDLDANSL